MAGFERIGALTEELRRIARDLDQGHVRYAAILNELHALGLPTGGAPHRRPRGRPRKVAASPSTTRRGRKGTMTSRVVDFLASSGGKSFMPREIAAGIGLSDKRRKSLSTTLVLLAKKKRIKKAAKGYSSAQ